MGNTIYSTADTTIYYPSDWLIEGGPTFESRGCPQGIPNDGDVNIPLELIYNQQTGYFGLQFQGFIVMESKMPTIIGNYVREYVQAFKDYLKGASINEMDNLK